jgi:hypothetical protein
LTFRPNRLGCMPVKFLRKTIATWRNQRESIAFAKAYHLESRARVAQLTAEGHGQEALRENLALMGIDTTKAERPRLVSIGGVRL